MAKRKADPRILEAFWTLAEGTDQRRIASAIDVIKVLDEKQKAHGDGISADLEYVVKRLVSGLASDRKLARQGFAVVLTQVLRRYGDIDVTYMCDVIKNNLNVKKSETKAERTSIGLGQIIAYITCIQSDIIRKADGHDIETVVSKLVSWSQRKAMLSQLCIQALTQMVSKVSAKTFKKHIWGELNALLSVGWNACSPDILLLLVKVIQNQAIPESGFLEEHWGTSSVVCTENFDSISKVFMDSTENHPVIHTACYEVITLAMEDDLLFSQLWKNIVNDKLMMRQAAKRYLAFQLLVHSLKQCTKLQQVKTIFSHNVIECLVNNLTGQKLLHGIAKLALNEIVKFFEACGDSQIQMAVLLALLREPGSIQFDYVTKTNTIATMMSALLPEAADSVMKILMEVMRGKPVLGGLDVSDMDVTRKWALPHLRNLITVATKSTDPDWQLGILQFLLIHAFFEVKENNAEIPHCVRLNQSFDESVQHLLQEAFHRALNNLATHQHGTDSSERRVHKDPRIYIETLNQLIQYTQLLLSKNEYVELRNPMKSKAANQWDNVISKVHEIRSKVTVTTPMGEGHAFQLLFLHLGFQLLTDAQNAVEVLEDLWMCYSKAFQKKRRMSVKKADLEEPEWVDVVTELLLSLLSQSSHLVRVVVGNVFSMLIPLITDKSIQLILDVIGSDGKEGEEGPVAFEDDEEIDEEMEDGESKDADEAENESSDSSDEDDDEMNVDENFRFSIKAALGDAAVNSDEEDHEGSDSDMSDAAMERIDHVLSEAFRSMTKKKTDQKEAKIKQQQLKHFKLRCLDLLENLVKHTAPVSKLINLLLPLLNVTEMGLKGKKQKEISDKATAILNTLCKSKRAYIDVGLDKSVLPGIIKKLLDFSTKATGVSLVKEISSAILFVIRVLQGNKQDSGPSPAKTRSRAHDDSKDVKQMKEQTMFAEEVLSIMRETLTTFFKKRDSHFNYFLLHEILKRQPGTLFWPLTEDLVHFATSPDVRVFCKTHACSMVTNLMSKNTPDEIGEAAWKVFTEKRVQLIVQALHGISEEDIRPKYLQEILTLLNKSLLVSGGHTQPEFDEEILTKVKELSAHVKADTKRACNRFLSQLQNRDKKTKKRTADEAAINNAKDNATTKSNSNGHLGDAAEQSSKKSKQEDQCEAKPDTVVAETNQDSADEADNDTTFTEVKPRSLEDGKQSKTLTPAKISAKHKRKTPKKTPKSK